MPTDTRQTDPDLAAVFDAWPALPEVIRAGIVAMVKASGSLVHLILEKTEDSRKGRRGG